MMMMERVAKFKGDDDYERRGQDRVRPRQRHCQREKDTIGGPSQLSPWKFGAQVHGRKRLRPRQSDEQASINEFRFLDDLNGV